MGAVPESTAPHKQKKTKLDFLPEFSSSSLPPSPSCLFPSLFLFSLRLLPPSLLSCCFSLSSVSLLSLRFALFRFPASLSWLTLPSCSVLPVLKAIKVPFNYHTKAKYPPSSSTESMCASRLGRMMLRGRAVLNLRNSCAPHPFLVQDRREHVSSTAHTTGRGTLENTSEPLDEPPLPASRTKANRRFAKTVIGSEGEIQNHFFFERAFSMRFEV